MKSVKLLTAAALLSGVVVAGAASTASAAIVCNGEGACWHTRAAYNYHPEWGLVVHDDHWRWGANDHYQWREHPGRGYWRNGGWVRF